MPPIAKPKAARYGRADRLPDDVIAHHEPSWKLGSMCQMTGVDVKGHCGSRPWMSQLGGFLPFPFS
jgi:hypothetical protein